MRDAYRLLLICLAVLALLTFDVHSVPMALAETALVKPRYNVRWVEKTIDGSIKLFFGLFGSWLAVLLGVCGPGMLNCMGIVNTASPTEDLTACVMALGASTALVWAGLVVSSDGEYAHWGYNRDSAVAQKREKGYNWVKVLTLTLVRHTIILYVTRSMFVRLLIMIGCSSHPTCTQAP